jgi:hypothetical protein
LCVFLWRQETLAFCERSPDAALARYHMHSHICAPHTFRRVFIRRDSLPTEDPFPSGFPDVVKSGVECGHMEVWLVAPRCEQAKGKCSVLVNA